MMSRLKKLKEELKNLGKRPSLDLEAEHEKVSRELGELNAQIAETERLARRDQDVAEVNALQDILDECSGDFDATIGKAHEAWQALLEHLKEAQGIVAFLTRAKELGRQVSDPPEALRKVHVPEGVADADFRTQHGLDGLGLLRQRIREKRYFKAQDVWFSSQGLT